MNAIDETLAETLLAAARATLQADLDGAPAPQPSLPDVAVGGLFVTLYDEDGEVRGSRGTTDPQLPLAGLLRECVRLAALDDPRFPPLDAAALSRCKLAVTVLGPPARIASPEAIEPGVTAVRVTNGLFSGTTLPEVAWGRGWDAAVYLAFACRKAALHAFAWEEPATEVLAYRTWRAAEPW